MDCTLRLARPSELEDVIAIDAEASVLFVAAGISVMLPDEHPFVQDELARWRQAIADATLYLAVDAIAQVVGFAAHRIVDGAPYLDQLAVRPTHMRRGLGRALVERVIAAAPDQPLWLTTYDHLAFNRPYYERLGFARVDEATVGPELRAILASQRAVLPAPEHRVAMVRAITVR